MTAPRFSPDSRLRSVLDLTWAVGFVTVLFLLWLRSSGASSIERALSLELREGRQQQGLYRHGRRLGSVTLETRRMERGWRLDHRLLVGEKVAARAQLRLRSDLSLAHLALEADLLRLGDLAGFPAVVLRQLGGEPRLAAKGECQAETGSCELQADVAGRRLTLPVMAGRGPVLAEAIYPLLVRGSLGNQAELTIFDPLALRQQVVTYRVEGREAIRLAGINTQALRVRRELLGQTTRLWLDSSGKVLREELPLGFSLEHEGGDPGPRSPERSAP